MKPTRNPQHVNNPMLALPETHVLMALPDDVRHKLADAVRALSVMCHQKGKDCFARRKYTMAAYWCAVGVYANHTSRAICPSSKLGRRVIEVSPKL